MASDTVCEMCRRTTCPNCDRPSWAGCGAHVDQVLADVAVADRCTCTAAEKRAARKGFFARLFGR